MPRIRRPTQADIARLANVSQAMVSYVLNGKAAISVPDETRQRILAAADRLGYVPDKAARSLRTRKSYTIAGIIPDITNPFYPAFERGIQDVAEHHGYDLITYNTDGVAERESKCLRSAVQGGVDGVIIMPYRLSAGDLLPLLRINVAVVVLGRFPTQVGGFPLDSVYVDSVAAARAATTYLIERGHTRIGMIAGAPDTPPARDRMLGYRQALAEHGVALDERLVCSGAVREVGGYHAMRELLTLAPRPTAVFAANDLLAMGAILAIREAGLSVPDNVAVVGFDDIPAARLVWPPLTTIAQFPANLGRRAAELLIERLNGVAPPTGRSEELPYQFVIRGSA